MDKSMIFLDKFTERPATLCSGSPITARSSAILVVALAIPKALKLRHDPSVSPAHLVQIYESRGEEKRQKV
jgi:hypothetical protein